MAIHPELLPAAREEVDSSGPSRGRALSSLRAALPSLWLWLLAIAVLGELLARGPLRALRTSHDLSVHYASARVWLSGGNPYDMREVGEAFLAGGGPVASVPTQATMPSVYPPVGMPLEAPLALLPWRTAVAVWAAISLSLALAAVAQLSRHAGLAGPWRTAAILGMLALAPLQTGLGNGQAAIPSAALLLLGWTFLETHPTRACLLMSLGAAVKPQLAIPFVLAAIVCAPWRRLARAAAVALALFGGLFALGAWQIQRSGHLWLREWIAAVQAAAGHGGMNNASPENSYSASLICLEMLWVRLTSTAALREVLTALLVGPAVALALWRAAKRRDRQTELLALATLCVASLLAMYHRTYDAFLLAVPIAAFVSISRGLSRPARALFFVCIALFFQPGAPLLDVAYRSGKIPEWLAQSTFWKIFIFPHQVWALLGLEVLLAILLAKPTCLWREAMTEARPEVA